MPSSPIVRALIGAAALLIACPLTAQTTTTPTSAPSAADRARALRVLASHPVFDGHNDLPWRIREDKSHPGDVAAYDLR